MGVELEPGAWVTDEVLAAAKAAFPSEVLVDEDDEGAMSISVASDLAEADFAPRNFHCPADVVLDPVSPTGFVGT